MYLIVGIDPGKTGAIACIDLSGKLIFNDHRRFGGIDWFVESINKIGTPIIVASDKPKANSIVRKINASFNARLFLPEREFKIEEKRIVARGIGLKNPHERDAYIAAIYAYNFYSNKFKQIEHIAHESNNKNVEQIKAKVVGKYSIREAIENRKANRK